AELLVDLGCRADNYCSDQTRTWRVGRAPAPAFDKTMELVRKAQDESIAMMRPGVKCADVYKKALEIFEKEGQGKAFNHALGHGIGLLTHEAPSLSPRSETTLEEGMVVTVEPGLYYADWGGVRWENTVVVTRDGAEIL
ncbi:MAG: M24 family metallopeptidase, partial [Desulfovibrio sp.]|nr:M24 family metallopeptidase [Desulfovibrio sp.]